MILAVEGEAIKGADKGTLAGPQSRGATIHNGPMNLLVLGGTGFLSSAVARRAYSEGLAVTALSRGRQPAPHGVELRIGDRSEPDGLAAVRDLEWDAVVDISSQPGHVRRAVTQLRTAHRLYVSSANVYARTDIAEQDETSELHPPLADDTLVEMADYGAAKAACEQIVRDASAATTIIRPGLIGGKGDASGRSGYYVWRFAHPTGHDVLVPPDLDFPVSFIDVEDLAVWIVHGIQQGIEGTFNADGPRTTLDEILRISRSLAGSSAPPARPVPADVLERAGVTNWMGPASLPLWIADRDQWLFGSMDVSAARAAGLTHRPYEETLAEALAYEQQRTEPRMAGLTDDEEIALRKALDGQDP